MRAIHIKLALGTLLILCLAIVLFLQERRLEQLRAENGALQKQARQAAMLRQEPPGRAQPPSSAAEAGLLRQRSELLRLRDEVTRLRNEARQKAAVGATAAITTAGITAAESESRINEGPFTAAANVSLSSGQTFATGGWITSPGFRTFLLAKPVLSSGTSGNGPGITIDMSLLKVAEGELPEALRSKLDAEAQAESFVLTGSEVAFLTNKLSSTGGTNVLSRPRIATSDGVPASLFVGETRPNPDGTQRQVGTRINISPQVTNGQTITMAVDIEYTPREDN